MSKLRNILGFPSEDNEEARQAQQSSRDSLAEAHSAGQQVNRLRRLVQRERQANRIGELFADAMFRPRSDDEVVFKRKGPG